MIANLNSFLPTRCRWFIFDNSPENINSLAARPHADDYLISNLVRIRNYWNQLTKDTQCSIVLLYKCEALRIYLHYFIVITIIQVKKGVSCTFTFTSADNENIIEDFTFIVTRTGIGFYGKFNFIYCNEHWPDSMLRLNTHLENEHEGNYWEQFL